MGNDNPICKAAVDIMNQQQLRKTYTQTLHNNAKWLQEKLDEMNVEFTEDGATFTLDLKGDFAMTIDAIRITSQLFPYCKHSDLVLPRTEAFLRPAANLEYWAYSQLDKAWVQFIDTSTPFDCTFALEKRKTNPSRIERSEHRLVLVDDRIRFKTEGLSEEDTHLYSMPMQFLHDEITMGRMYVRPQSATLERTSKWAEFLFDVLVWPACPYQLYADHEFFISKFGDDNKERIRISFKTSPYGATGAIVATVSMYGDKGRGTTNIVYRIHQSGHLPRKSFSADYTFEGDLGAIAEYLGYSS